MSSFSLKVRLLFLVATFMAGLVAITAVFLVDLYSSMMNERKGEIRHIVEAAVSQLKGLDQAVRDGRLTKAEAHERAADMIHAIRFDGGNYLFVYSFDSTTVLHGTRADRENKDASGEKDAYGTLFARQQVAHGKAGSGYTTYYFPRAGDDPTPRQKISFEMGFAPWEWVVAGGVYVDDIDSAFYAQLRVLGTIIALVLIVLGAASYLFSRSIFGPLERLSGELRAIGDGNLDVDITTARRRDEIGAIGKSVVYMRDRMREGDRLKQQQAEQERAEHEAVVRREQLAKGFVEHMQRLATGFATSSREVADAARNLSATAEETSRQAQAVAGAAEEASSNVQTVAASSEEMAASIHEINSQVTTSVRIADSAFTEAETSNARISDLATAAAAIGDVVNLIKSIADQTNLLALNATIEAARAGEAGRGFAVVASEVKELAAQTARATEDIRTKVGEIQEATDSSVQSVSGIARVIGTVREIAEAISRAIEQQSAATSEIAQNCQQAATGTHQVMQNISGVGQAAGMTGSASTQLMTLSSGLSDQAHELRQAVDDFVTSFAAAA